MTSKSYCDAKFKVIDSQFEVVSVKFQKLDGYVADVRQEVQVIRCIFHFLFFIRDFSFLPRGSRSNASSIANEK